MKRGWQWPVLVTAALLFTVGVNVVMLFAASGDKNGSVVEPDYYRKAVEWDRTMARRAESARLGWRSSVSIGALASDEREVSLVLRDSAGAALSGADVAVTLIHNGDAANPIRGKLSARSEADRAGEYRATLPLTRSGLWEVRVEARRTDERFYATLHTNAP